MLRRLIASLLAATCVALPQLALAADVLSAKARLKSCQAPVALAAAKDILNDARTLNEPLEMFWPALTLFQSGEKDEALFWFYAAQLRLRYQQAVAPSSELGQLLQIMLMTVGPPINNYGFQDVSRLDRQLERVLAWDRATPNPLREKSPEPKTQLRIDQVYTGFRELRARLQREEVELEAQAKAAAAQMEQMAAQMRPRPC